MTSLTKRYIVASTLSYENKTLLLQPSVVRQLGRSQSLFLQQLHYYLDSNTSIKMIDGIRYIGKTFDDWKHSIEIYSVSTIKRCITSLRELGIISTIKLNKSKGDHKNFYTINYEKLKEIGLLKDQNEPIIKETNKNIINKSNKSRQKKIVKVEEKEKKPLTTTAQDMIAIYNRYVGEPLDDVYCLNKKRAKFLVYAFKNVFNQTMSMWESFCQIIAESKFLMGKTKTVFKAKLDWILKLEIIKKIINGNFSIATKEFNNYDAKYQIQETKHEEIEDMDAKNKRKHIEMLINGENSASEGKKIRLDLLNEFGEDVYYSYFLLSSIRKSGDQYILTADNAYASDHLQEKYGKILKNKFKITVSENNLTKLKQQKPRPAF